MLFYPGSLLTIPTYGDGTILLGSRDCHILLYNAWLLARYIVMAVTCFSHSAALVRRERTTCQTNITVT